MAWLPPTVFPPRPPIPMARTQRPGGYWTPPDILNGLKGGGGAFLGDALADFGYGLTQGGFDKGFEYAGQRTAQMTPLRTEADSKRREQELAVQRAKANAAFIPDPEIAAAVASGQMDFQQGYSLWQDKQKGATGAALPSSVEEYKFYANEELTAGRSPMPYGEWMQTGRNGAAGPQLGLQPQWGIGPDGKPVLGQMSSDGRFVPTTMPEGVSPMDPAAAAGNKAGAVVDAKAQGEARKLLPGMEQAVTITRQAIDNLRANKEGMAEQFGNVGVLPWPQRWSPVIPGSARGNFLAELEQANGQAFMQARQMLKGGGQITDYEGRRGEAAYSRMQAASETGDMDSFLAALEDFEAAVADGYKKLQEVAGGTYAPADPSGTPDANIDELLKKYL